MDLHHALSTTLAPPRPRRPAGVTRTTRPLPLVAALGGFGGRTALVTGDGAELTYGALAAHIGQRASELGSQRRLVMITGGNDVETVVTYLAALHGGHVAWLSPDGPHAAHLADVFEPDVVARCDGAGTRLEEHGTGAARDLHPDLALLLGTSGSTGAPRLVRISHDGLQSNAVAIARYLDIDGDEAAITALPPHYCYGLSVINSHLLRGARLLLSQDSVADPGFWSLLRDAGGTSFAGVPHTFDLLDRVGFEGMDLPTLRYITQAGGRMAPERVRRYARLGARRGWRLVVMYGQTEATARMAYLPPELAERHPGAIGVPIPGGSFEIRPVEGVDEPGVGEIVYRGPNVMLGYAQGPADLAVGRVAHELPTGDLGRRGAGGLYEVVGRRSRFLKLQGHRVDLDQVERLLARDGVAAVCAGTDDRLVVAVAGAAPEGLARRLAARLGVAPAAVEAHGLEAIPRLPNGKPDHRAIAALPSPGRGRGEPGVDIAALFRRVLERDEVPGDATFAGLGGDSLSYVEMSMALEESLGRLPAHWPEMTVHELQALQPRRRAGARLETGIVLRATAIVLVVASHMTAFWPAGGAHLLLALAGHSFARFQLAMGGGGRWLARSTASIARIAVPTSTWIGLQLALTGMYSVGALLLVNDYAGDPSYSNGRWHYWFVEALVQILVVASLLLAIPAVRRLERAHSLAFVLTALALALTVRFDVAGLGGGPNHFFRPHAVAWIFLLGWAVQRATTPLARTTVSVVVLAAVPGFFGDPARDAVVGGGLLLLVWVPVVRLPRPVSRVLGVIAAASLFIYLTHWQVFPPLLEALPVAVALPLTIAAGVAAWLAVDRLSSRAARGGARRLARTTWGVRPRLSRDGRMGAPRDRPVPEALLERGG